MDAPAEFDRSSVREAARGVLEAHWVSEGYTVPNPATYPWLWLWDSCFHAVCWAELGDERSLIELQTALSVQDEDGFVPHMNYVRNPGVAADLWGRDNASSITQPPMYGHAVAELVRRGVDVDEETVARAERGLRFLLFDRHRLPSGLVALCHPWESGADDSPRWDDFCPGGFSLESWRPIKNRLVTSIVRSPTGSPLANPAFESASAGFNALVVFNAWELATVTGRSEITDRADVLAGCLADQWDESRRTWTDAGAAESGSGRARTLDGLLPLLVAAEPERVEAVAADLTDPSAYGGWCGPAGVHRGEPGFDPRSYWRGPAWPQLNYLVWLGLRRQGRQEAAAQVASTTVRGAMRSGFSEYWDPDDGTGGGAAPQSWTALAALMV
ncbi:MGH1-like glycoside hydrolase domain-containing protein [Candidatus Poriferisocius sp.]|uniref:MGH1-like glycoside hydrolase domain-containing protein n=1 Tax=Candidatus Poriferisocius sp. TaxID=3101276 RepID=UPI003B02ABD1